MDKRWINIVINDKFRYFPYFTLHIASLYYVDSHSKFEQIPDQRFFELSISNRSQFAYYGIMEINLYIYNIHKNWMNLCSISISAGQYFNNEIVTVSHVLDLTISK